MSGYTWPDILTGLVRREGLESGGSDGFKQALETGEDGRELFASIKSIQLIYKRHSPAP